MLITSLCAAHAAMVWSAEYWSPLTRDLAVRHNDEPRRRTVYINISVAMLFCAAFVVAFPMIAVAISNHCPFLSYSYDIGSIALAVVALSAAIIAVACTLVKTRSYLKRPSKSTESSSTRLYPLQSARPCHCHRHPLLLGAYLPAQRRWRRLFVGRPLL
jgi:hypothetical protein